ncbi:hypothetical protein EDC94DRAFT_320131 [Helicostylum pulchrum]|nr:hypothetical protein EDC94DRAFT_320131 [Helicostylum pulchrum]
MNKGSYKCSLFVKNKRKNKGEKIRLEEAKCATTAVPICALCNDSGPKNSRAKECPDHKPNVDEFLKSKLRGKYEHYTVRWYQPRRKKKKKKLFVEKVTNLSSFIRNVIFRVYYSCLCRFSKKKIIHPSCFPSKKVKSKVTASLSLLLVLYFLPPI